jgi:hypothetical protein
MQSPLTRAHTAAYGTIVFSITSRVLGDADHRVPKQCGGSYKGFGEVQGKTPRLQMEFVPGVPANSLGQ